MVIGTKIIQKKLGGSIMIRCRSAPGSPRSDYHEYKPLLRKDFNYSCAYCDVHEGESRGFLFTIDHFRPQEKFENLKNEYSNLYWACSKCNRNKWHDWPSDDPVKDGVGYLDPCIFDYDKLFKVDDSTFEVKGTISAANYMVVRLKLNRPFLLMVRSERKRRSEELENYSILLKMLEEKLKVGDGDPIVLNFQMDSVRQWIAVIEKEIRDSRTPLPD